MCCFQESALTIKQLKVGTTSCRAPALRGSSSCHYLLEEEEDLPGGLAMTQQPGQTGCFRGFRLKSNFRALMDLEVSWVLNFQACQA